MVCFQSLSLRELAVKHGGSHSQRDRNGPVCQEYPPDSPSARLTRSTLPTRVVRSSTRCPAVPNNSTPSGALLSPPQCLRSLPRNRSSGSAWRMVLSCQTVPISRVGLYPNHPTKMSTLGLVRARATPLRHTQRRGVEDSSRANRNCGAYATAHDCWYTSNAALPHPDAPAIFRRRLPHPMP
jgi:hypothetical protein